MCKASMLMIDDPDIYFLNIKKFMNVVLDILVTLIARCQNAKQMSKYEAQITPHLMKVF